MTVESECAALLRRLLEEVDAGRLDAPGGQGLRLLRRIEGAAIALEQTAGRGRGRRRSGSRAPKHAGGQSAGSA